MQGALMLLCKFSGLFVAWLTLQTNLVIISFVVDAADREKLEAANAELKNLLEKPQLANIPVLVLGNKNDLPEALTAEELIEAL